MVDSAVRSLSLHNIADEEDVRRIRELQSVFQFKYQKKPQFYGRAPGRVNLIGEHIDYCGYSVLPMAIQQDIMIAGLKTETGVLRLSNTDSLYSDFECLTSDYVIDKKNPKWYHYFLCGFRGVMEHFKLSKTDGIGMDLVVSGCIPPSAGLSSSSAMVCASALITAALLERSLEITKTEFAQICCDCERYIGTQGGGMDQSISFLAESGKAKLIEFDPIRAYDVVLPEDVVFVISHSLAELNKAATSHFNQRVVECRLSCQLLAAKHQLDWRKIKRLGDLQCALAKTTEGMLQLVEDTFHEHPYTKSEICQLLSVTPEELGTTSLSQNTMHLESFKLYQRAKHVFSEAHRVVEFKRICDEQPPCMSERLAALMNQSHVSTRDLYECSHPDLDELVDICRESGALGSRLTGAGWGGCAVSMVKVGCLDNFMSAVRMKFYTPNRLKERNVNSLLFASAPAPGANIYFLS